MNDYTVKVACTTYYSASFEAKTFDEAKKLAEESVAEEFDTWSEIDNDYQQFTKLLKIMKVVMLSMKLKTTIMV